MTFASGNDTTGTIQTHLMGGLDSNGQIRAVAVDNSGRLETSGGGDGGGGGDASSAKQDEQTLLLQDIVIATQSTDITTLDILGNTNLLPNIYARLQDEIARLESIRDRLPATGTATETTLANILSNLPSATKPALVRSMYRKWREDFNGNALSADWVRQQTGAGHTVNVGSSNLAIATGTTPNTETIITGTVPFTIPFRVLFTFAISQRVANQEFYLEVVDASGNHRASIIFDGTSSSTAKLNCANNGNSTGSISLTNFSTGGYGIAELEVSSDEINLYARSVNSSSGRSTNITLTRQIPDPNLEYFLRIRAKNLVPPPTTTTFTLDAILVQDLEEITAEITAGRGGGGANQCVPVVFPSIPNVAISNVPSVTTINASSIVAANTPLIANFIFTSNNYTSTGYAFVRGWVRTDQPGTLIIQQSQDATIWEQLFPAINCAAGITPFEQKLYSQYFRFVYTNGAQAQTLFRLISTRSQV